MRRLIALAFLVVLGGCGHSPPTRFYTLNAVPPQRPMDADPTGHVEVAPVNLPPVLDQRAVVLRSGANQIVVSDRARWAAPLDGMVRRILAEDLAERLGHGRVLAPGDPVPAGPLLTVVLTMEEFGGSKDGEAVLAANWAIQGAHQRVLLMRHVRLTQAVAPDDIGALAAALSAMLGKVSDDLAVASAQSPGAQSPGAQSRGAQSRGVQPARKGAG